MAKILITGNVERLSEDFLAPLCEEHDCILYGERNDLDHIKHLDCYHPSQAASLEELYKSYHFHTVIYLSKAIDGTMRFYDEVEMIEENVYFSTQYHVTNFTLVASNDTHGIIGKESNRTRARRTMMMTGERLLFVNANPDGLHVQILHVPYLYATKSSGHWDINEQIGQLITEKKVMFNGQAEAQTDFLHDGDLGELCARIVDAPAKKEFMTFDLDGGNEMARYEVARILTDHIADTTIAFHNYTLALPIHLADDKARQEYGWFPLHVLLEDLPLMEKNAREHIERMNREKFHMADRFRSAMEILSLFILSEILNRVVQGNVTLQFLDFRLLAVLISGTMNGMMPGIMSSVLASVGYLISSRDTLSLDLLLFNVQNWLPFAAYFLLGSVAGYNRDKNEDIREDLKAEYGVLEKKYRFLNRTYREVLESSERYNSQIIGYQNSYGKIYNVIKKLDATVPDRVMYEAVHVLEEMLDNQSIGIYSATNGSPFARLAVCSRSVRADYPRSRDMEKRPQIYEKLLRNEAFINHDCIEDYPSYAVPINYNGELIGIVEVLHASNWQMNTEFANKLFILSSLIGASLFRATRYQDANDMFLEGTNIINPEHFEEILEVRSNMKQKRYADYALLQLSWDQNIHNLSEVEGILLGAIRGTDLCGQRSNGEFYVLLSQAGAEGPQLLKNRLMGTGIRLKEVTL